LDLGAPVPNPFRLDTRVDFVLPEAEPVRLHVYDLHGRRVRLLPSASLPAGRHRLVWNGKNDSGRPAPSGVYLLQLEAGGRRFLAGRAVLLR
jgi:flagellar hook assembly protein FlgD